VVGGRPGTDMGYKFEKLEVWQVALEYSEKLFAKLQAFRTSLTTKPNPGIREEPALYEYDDTPF
jgi:hypothetical protein